ncbi:TPA: hypothetical protein TZM76_002138 [Streptococcus suis]|nr:hypothetical protein [Streptococcus suis]HEL2333067.1 hypothetical protein [Streptococcus suis]HEM2757060.1 hypothetical protein [Streptococcus suis]
MSSEKSYLGEFTFTNEAVSSEFESLIDEVSGLKTERLVIKSINLPYIEMGYSPGEGLKIITWNRRKNNPLGEFLGLDLNNLSELKNFIHKYGFIYPISQEKYCPVDIEELHSIQERLKAFINLINNQNKSNIEYRELFDSTLYLLLRKYSTTSYKKSKFLPTNSALQNQLDAAVTPLTKDHSAVKTVSVESQAQLRLSRYSESLNKMVEFDLLDAQQIMQDENTPHWCKRIFNLFYSLDNLVFTDELNKKIDFLFGCIYLLNPFYSEQVKIKETFSAAIYEDIEALPHFTEYLLEVSKITIREEFERMLDDIHFTYNTETMAPDWKLPSLISALYFSIYYKNSKNVIYRVCQNDYCKQYFEVSSTNSTKRHCSDNCRDSKNARIMRQRKKQENN